MSFSFGTPSSAPATGLSGGFSFGANKAATPGFGLGGSQPSQGLFGTPATSASAFGTATPSFGSTPAFGATSTAPTFGASTPAFGANSAAPTFGVSTTPAFGATATPAFGATSTAPAFGATSAAPAFGATSTPAFGAATTAPAFGTATPAFGNTSFGTSLGTGLNFGTTTTNTATGLSFGSTSTTSAGLGGLGGFGTTTAQTSFALGGTTTTGSFATTSVGLGGVAPTSTTGAADGKNEPPKQTKLPNEIATTVEAFKEFVKRQKSLSSDIMRVSIKPMQKVSREAECTLRLAAALSGETSRCRAQSRRLRTSAAAALAAAESASRDPGGDSAAEGATPPAYVAELIAELEQQVAGFRRQMDAADRQMRAAPEPLAQPELSRGLRRMHAAFVALAARLQAAHAQVQAQAAQYANLRKYVLKDPDVFGLDALQRPKAEEPSGARPALGPGSVRQLAGPTPFTYIGSSLSPFSAGETQGSNWRPAPRPVNSTLNSSAFGSQMDSFQLQKPPGKRGKQ